jgi:hypothetical protein
MRGVFLGGILAILITFLLVAVGCSAIDFILWAYFNLFVGSVEIQTFGIVFLMMMVFVGLFYTFSILENHKYDMQDTFVYQSYNAVKNKMCFRVDVED